jgi:uncharacterized membrane protein YcaP (DUF421 family)
MKEILIEVVGEGKDLNILKMSSRGIVIFSLVLALIRISGRRSSGLRTPLDNIISISLGAIMSRAVVGASAFVPVIVCCLVIVTLHRLLGWLIIYSKRMSGWIEGEKITLYRHEKFNADHMKRGLVCREDVMQGIRRSALTEDINQIDKVFLERNGEISAIKNRGYRCNYVRPCIF